MRSRRQKTHEKADAKNSQHDKESEKACYGQEREDKEEDLAGVSSPVKVVATAGASGQSLVDPLVPPPKWL